LRKWPIGLKSDRANGRTSPGRLCWWDGSESMDEEVDMFTRGQVHARTPTTRLASDEQEPKPPTTTITNDACIGVRVVLWRKGRERFGCRVACVPLAGGSRENVNREALSTRPHSNPKQIWVENRSARASRSVCARPLDQVFCVLVSTRTNLNSLDSFGLASRRYLRQA
jgi:hypothetical protein